MCCKREGLHFALVILVMTVRGAKAAQDLEHRVTLARAK